MRRADYDRVYKEGKRRASRHFLLFIRANAESSRAGTTRLGISVKRTLGGAVIRNKIRRRIREIFRTRRQEIRAGWDIVVHPRSNAVARADFAALSAELVSLFPQAEPS